MRGYILGIQRVFAFQWGYDLKFLEGNVFDCPTKRIMAVLENKLILQQSKGVVAESHNARSKEYFTKVCDSSLLDRATPLEFQARLIFSIASIGSMRSYALVHLTTGNVQNITCGRELVWKNGEIICNRTGESSIAMGGWGAFKDQTQEMCVWKRSHVDGKLILFEDIEDYMRVRGAMDCGSDPFLGFNARATTFDKSFKRQHLG